MVCAAADVFQGKLRDSTVLCDSWESAVFLDIAETSSTVRQVFVIGWKFSFSEAWDTKFDHFRCFFLRSVIKHSLLDNSQARSKASVETLVLWQSRVSVSLCMPSVC